MVARWTRRGAGALAGTLLAVGFYTSHPADAYSGSPAGATPTGTAVHFDEFVNDGAGGHLWNQYDQTVDAAGPDIIGRASAVNFGPSVLDVFTTSANGDLVDWINDGLQGRVWNAYDLTQTAGAGRQVAGSPAAIVVNGVIHVFVEAAGRDLVEYVSDGTNGHVWNAYDLSTAANGGSPLDGDPTVVDDGGIIRVFVRAFSGDLVEYADDGASGAQWNAYDLSSTAAGGGPVGGDPSAVLYNGKTVHVYVGSASGDLIEYVDDHASGQLWNAYDQTQGAGGGVQIEGDPAAVVDGAVVHVYAGSATGDLVEFVNDDLHGHLWNTYDHTTDAGGGVQLVGDPAAVLYGPVVHVYVRSLSDHLVEFVNDDAGGHLWNAYDQTDYAGGGTDISTDPSAILYGGSQVHVYVGGPSSGLADNVVALAETQDQYDGAVVESPPDSNCNGYTAYFGRGSTAGCAPGTSAEEWCSDFSQWVWTLNGIDTAGITGYAFTFVQWGENHGTFQPGSTNSPEPGDAVVWGSMAQGYAAHVGLVVGVKDGDIDMVSGNSGPVDASGNVVSVWETGYFDPASSTDSGYPILGYVAP
ncbi:MAG TPA: CHAP domain-containing protein [Acidimicrobiales bacterium]|nr:CHAP domain-containing protein [Acidimicrobiales bacterium]